MDMVPSPDHTDTSQTSANIIMKDQESFDDPAVMQGVDDYHDLQSSIHEDSINQDAANPGYSQQALPCLKGTMTYVGGVVYCKGKWGMSAAAHDTPGQTSDFEFKLMKADENGSYFPVSGLYQGWFNVKQPPPAKGSVKVDDKEMKITYTLGENGSHTINGEGHNRYGQFRLFGTLTQDGKVVMYREYFVLNPLPVQPLPTPKKVKVEKKKEAPTGVSSSAKKDDAASREGGRVRRQSSLLKEFADPLQRTKSQDSLEKLQPVNMKPIEPISRASLTRSSSDRAPRLTSAMKRCLDLLKELTKHPQAIWFLEPVDPIALNIPDYPRIIKNPMDFSTIRYNIENGIYENMHGFAEHMRLVFKNAMTFNQLPDNPVHIAAKDLSNRFEDKFRWLLRQVDPETDFAEAPKPLQRSSSSGPATTNVKKRNSKEPSLKAFRANGPRPQAMSFLPPAAMDGSTQTILELQRMMQSMQDEIKQLRATVKEKEVMQKVMETKEAAMNPLTYEEKKTLITQIHNLPPHKMDQQFIDQDNSENKKKRPYSSTPNLSRSASTGKAEGAKKSKKARTSTSSSAAAATAAPLQGEQLLNADAAELLFEPDENDPIFNDSYDVAPHVGMSTSASNLAQGYAMDGFDDSRSSEVAQVHVSNVDAWMSSGSSAVANGKPLQEEEDGEDSNLWSAAADEIRAKRSDVDTYG
eukprot:gene492-531_t